MNITEALQLHDERPTVLQLKNSEKSQIIAIGLKKDQVLKKHVTTIPAMLVVLKGEILFEMEGTSMQLSALNTFDIPLNTPHEVTGMEESIFLVIKEKA